MKTFTPKTSIEAEAKLDELRAKLARSQADAQALQVKRQHADAEVAKLTEAARSGKLKSPALLCDALLRQASLQAEPMPEVSTILAEISTMEAEKGRLRQEEARHVYLDAVSAYAKACAPLPALAQRIRDAAPAAGVLLTNDNSPSLIGRYVVIADAVVDIPRA